MDFCQAANEAFEEGDAKGLATAFTKWERFNNMENWQVKCIKIIFDEMKPKGDDGASKKNETEVSVAAPPLPTPTTTTNSTTDDAPVVSDDDDDDESDLL